jgi:hypothetical protein
MQRSKRGSRHGGDAARGSQLHDSLGGLPWLAWLFVVLALLDVVWFVVDSRLIANPAISDFVVYALQIVPSVVAVLLPAALLSRHPDAMTRARTLLLGTILFAIVQGLQILAQPLEPWFEEVTPPSGDLQFLVPLTEVYNGLISLVTAVAIACIALGLSRARWFEDRSEAPIALFLPVVAVLATVAGVLTARAQLVDAEMSIPLVVYLVASVTLGVIRVVAWAYLATVAARGWGAGEEPRAGWRLAVIGAGLILVAIGLFDLNGVLDVQDPTVVLIYGYVVVAAFALGHLCLLAAFAIGLPALDEADVDADDAADVDDDPDDVDDTNDDARFEEDGPWGDPG